jgi:hypothetical protein
MTLTGKLDTMEALNTSTSLCKRRIPTIIKIQCMISYASYHNIPFRIMDHTISAKPSRKHKKDGKFLITESPMYKAAADTRDHCWIEEIVLFENKCQKRKRLQEMNEFEKEERMKG